MVLLILGVSAVTYIVFVYLQEKCAPDEAALVAEHCAEDAPKGPGNMALSVGMAAVRKHTDALISAQDCVPASACR